MVFNRNRLNEYKRQGEEKGEYLIFTKEKPLKISGFQIRLWSWRESNPRPNEEAIRFLHAYLRLNFRV